MLRKLKELLCKVPVLRYPDYGKDFKLTTDASNVGLGAVLSQGHPCCFISRTLNGAEQNYSTTDKELLAIVWATQRLRQYLLGRTRGLRIVRIHFLDPTITPIEKIKLENLLNFLSNKEGNLNFHVCYSPQSELTAIEKDDIIKEAHGSIVNENFGENKTIDEARQFGEWKDIENDAIKSMKKCPVCQLQKTIRVKKEN